MRQTTHIFVLILLITGKVAYSQPFQDQEELSLLIKKTDTKRFFAEDNNSNNTQDDVFTKTELKVYPNAFDKNASLLLFLKKPASQIQLSVFNTMGKNYKVPVEKELSSGFYEIAIPPLAQATGIYTVELILDGEVYYQQIVR